MAYPWTSDGDLRESPRGTPTATIGPFVSPLRRRLRPLLLTAASIATVGCLQRTLPLPPPSVTAQAFTVCPPTECPDGGVIVELSGTSLPNAAVLLEDTNPRASVETGESLFVGTTADASGSWRLVMGPVPVRGTATVLVPRVGDALNLFQIAPPDNEVSSSRIITVLAPR